MNSFRIVRSISIDFSDYLRRIWLVLCAEITRNINRYYSVFNCTVGTAWGGIVTGVIRLVIVVKNNE